MRRNPDAVIKNKPASGIRNWIILGGVIVAGYFAYRYFNSPAADAMKQDLKSSASGKAGPDLNGPPVTKFQISSTQSTNCISEPQSGFTYAPISSYNPITKYNTFTSTANGRFTRRLLCKGNQRWAEIKPS